MSSPKTLYQWSNQVTSQFESVLSKPQARVLALYAFGMFLAQSCGLSAVVVALVPILDQSANTLRQRLREFYQPAQRKAGRHRRHLDVTVCFLPLLRWVLQGWKVQRLALALDPTNLGDRFTVLTISVVYRGLAIPIAWKVLRGNHPAAWNPHWQRLLRLVHGYFGPAWQVLVLADRGLESQNLFRTIKGLGWHPLLRVKAAGCFRPCGWVKFVPMARFARAEGCRWKGVGEAYKTATPRLECTLLACWEAGHDEPLLVLTDLPPRLAEPHWYALRSWIEQGFKIFKREGWQWQRTRMTDPARVTRLWLVLAVATLCVVKLGTLGEDRTLKPLLPPPQYDAIGKVQRRHRIFVVGLAILRALWVKGKSLPDEPLRPEKWPKINHQIDLLTEEMLL
jgi:hypothetical protein